jgi:hypothetical protein
MMLSLLAWQRLSQPMRNGIKRDHQLWNLIEDIWLNAPSRYGGSGDAPEQGIRSERELACLSSVNLKA